MNLGIRFAHLGILLLFTLVSIIVYFYGRDLSYLFYFFFLMAILTRMTIPSSIPDYFFGEMVNFSFYDYLASFQMLTVATAGFFTISVLDSADKAPKLTRILASYSWFTLFVGVFGLSGTINEKLFKIQDLSNMFGIFLSISAGIICYRNNSRPAKNYLIGWGVFLGSVVVWTLGNRNILPSNFFVDNAPIGGSIFEMIFMAISLSDRSRHRQDLEKVTEAQIAESNNLRILLRVLAHDICNPMAIIQGTAILESRRQTDPKVLKQWQRVHRAADSVTEIITSVRSIDALQSGKVKFSLKPVSMAKMYKEALFIFEERLEHKKVSLEFESPEGVDDLFVSADETSLSNNVINNLISNAIKFSPPDTTITMSVHEEEDTVIILVTDQGIGMPEDILIHIFDPRARTSRKGTDNEKGTGFGMPLVKSYVDHYGGTVSVTSKEDENCGTTVKVVLKKSAPPVEEIKDSGDDAETAA